MKVFIVELFFVVGGYCVRWVVGLGIDCLCLLFDVLLIVCCVNLICCGFMCIVVVCRFFYVVGVFCCWCS